MLDLRLLISMHLKCYKTTTMAVAFLGNRLNPMDLPSIKINLTALLAKIKTGHGAMLVIIDSLELPLTFRSTTLLRLVPSLLQASHPPTVCP